MAKPEAGKTYRFKCFGTSKRLNLYSSGTASDGMNVVLFTPDDTREQQWFYSNGRLYIKTNTAYCLDRFTGSAAPDNADIYKASSTDANEQLITFEEVSGYTNCVKIRLTNKVNGKYYYLTAVNTRNGTGSGKSKTSDGNVIWRDEISSDLQMWTFEEVSAGSDPYAALNWSYVFSDSTNASGYWGYSPTGKSNRNNGKDWIHWGIDVICDTGTPLRAPAAAEVFEVGSGGDRGNYIVLKMNQRDPVSGKFMYVRFLHMRDYPLVTSGYVAKNELLGYVGNSGTVTPHLHLDINIKDSNQGSGTGFSAANTINPVRLFPNISFPDNYYLE